MECGDPSMICFWVLNDEDFNMEIPNWILDKALLLGINHKGMNKFELIRAIQAREGNKQCYGESPMSSCQYKSCCWFKDCKGLL